MANFKKLRAQSGAPVSIHPREIFNRLPKPPEINDLWDSQAAVLQEWHRRRGQRDLVLKLNTGGGKTLVGLLIGQSLTNELRKPVLYLCPNLQLVAQTLEKAQQVRISALPYERGKAPLPTEFLNANALLVGTYQALFNGRSKFGPRDATEPVDLGAVICDDAHAAFSSVRDQFSISIDRTEHPALYDDIVGRFASDFQEIQRAGTFEHVLNKTDGSVLEVPYWAWKEKAQAIQWLLQNNSDYSNAFRYQLPLLRDAFDYCHVLIRSSEILITPFLPLVNRLPSFDECNRRIYMSATIADDTSIIRTFGASPKAVASPIAPTSLAGVGERMILAPGLTGMSEREARPMVKQLCTELADTVGVVVLVPSEKAATPWKDIAEIVIGNNQVVDAVKRLTQGVMRKPVVFVNRYDGIDLVQQACRLLILDGQPYGSSAYDLYRATALRGNNSIALSFAQRIEQGLGRGTRGSGDYCAVILLGRDLIGWIARRDSLAMMTVATRVQIELGNEISASLREQPEFVETVMQSINRDPSWTAYHAEQLANRVEAAGSSALPSVDGELSADAKAADQSQLGLIDSAQLERDYLLAFEAMNYSQALDLMRSATDKHNSDKRLRGWLLQHAARAAAYWGNVSLSTSLQQEAYKMNNSMLRARAKQFYEPILDVGAQAKNICQAFSAYQFRSGLLEVFIDDVSILGSHSASANQFEEGVRHLGTHLGFSSSRPENDTDDGPDNLWLSTNTIGFIIESKHRNSSEKPLPERDHKQLLGSERWFELHYKKWKSVGIIIHPNATAEYNSSAQETWALTVSELQRMVADSRALFAQLASSQLDGQPLEQLCTRLLEDHKLSAEKWVEAYCKRFVVLPQSKPRKV